MRLAGRWWDRIRSSATERKEPLPQPPSAQTKERLRVFSILPHWIGSMTSESPAIYRCRQCGSLVHPADRGDEHPVGWCQRCERYVATDRDGG